MCFTLPSKGTELLQQCVAWEFEETHVVGRAVREKLGGNDNGVAVLAFGCSRWMVWRNEGTLSVQQRRKSCDPPTPRLPRQKAHAVIVDLDSDEEEEDVIVKTEVKQELKKSEG